MKILIQKNRVVIFCLLIFALGVAQSFADVQNVTIKAMNGVLKNKDGTVITDGSGFVQLINGSSANPPKGVATTDNSQLSGGSYATAVQAPYAGKDIKGTVGSYPDTPAGAGEFFLDNQLDHAIGTSYFMRYWTEDGYYVNSGSITPWSAGDPVPADMNFGVQSWTFWKAAEPYSPTITNITQKETLNKELFPNAEASATQISQLVFDYSAGGSDIEVKGDATHNQGYYLQISKNEGFSDFETSGSFTINRLTAPWNTFFTAPAGTDIEDVIFYARVAAYNYFGSTIGEAKPFSLAAVGTIVPGDGGQISSEFTFKKVEDGFGINIFAVSFAKVYDGEGQVIDNLQDLVGFINDAGEGHVTTIGYWDTETQKEVGFSLGEAGKLLDKINTTEEPADIEIGRAKAYQISVTKSVSFTVRNYQ